MPRLTGNLLITRWPRVLIAGLVVLTLAASLNASGMRAAARDGEYALRGDVLVALVVREVNWPQTYNGGPVFADVGVGRPDWQTIAVGYTHGIAEGFPCGAVGEPCDAAGRPYFRPNARVTRGEYAQMVALASGWPLTNGCVSARFSDVPCGDRRYKYVEAATAHGLLQGYPDGTFRPDAALLVPDERIPVQLTAVDQVVQAPTQATVASLPGSRFGVNLANTFEYTPGVTGGQVANAKAQQVRFGIRWGIVQRSSDSGYTWSPLPSPYAYDAALSDADSSGLDVSLILWGTPFWDCATGGPDPLDPTICQFDPPREPNRFADFAREAVRHYTALHPSVKQIEIYNEPDGYRAWGNDPTGYKNLVALAYNQIRTVNPTIPVVLGALAYDNPAAFNLNFLTQTLQAGIAPYIDAVNFHHYDFNSQWPNVGAAAQSLRTVMAAQGVSKPLLWTEAGMSSDPAYQGGSLSGQANYAARVNPWMLSAGLTSAIWYTFKDYGCPGDTFCRHGLVDVNNQPKLAYTAYQVSNTWLGDPGTTYTRALTCSELRVSCGNLEGHEVNRQHPNDVNHGEMIAWVKLTPGGKLGILKSRTPDGIGFYDMNGQQLCATTNGSCPSSADGTQWIWTLPDGGAAVYAFFAQPY